jgi:hypothetical protein
MNVALAGTIDSWHGIWSLQWARVNDFKNFAWRISGLEDL